MEWLINNVELFSAVYTFLGQFRFYQAIVVEAIPGRDPYLVDIQYNLRVEANYFYAISALLRIVIQYLKNLDLLLPEPVSETNQANGSGTTSEDNAGNTNVLLSSNKVSNLANVAQRPSTTVKIIRRPASKRWRENRNLEFVRINTVNNGGSVGPS